MKSDFIASVHKDYLSFIKIATDTEIGEFIRAQICGALGEEIPELKGMAKALFETHTQLIKRLEKSRLIKSEAGKLGGNPQLKQTDVKPNHSLNNDKPEVKQRLSRDKAELKPDTVTITVSESNSDTSSDGDNPPTPPQAGGKRGGRKPKAPPVPKTEYAEFVSMTNDEHTSLVAKLGEHGTARCIEILDNYKGAKGKKYASDYRAILSWVITRYNEEHGQNAASGGNIKPAEKKEKSVAELIAERNGVKI